MDSRTVRSVLAVYPANEGNSAEAYQALKAARLGDVRVFRGDEPLHPSKRDSAGRYAGLRLEGECLIVVQAAPARVPAIVHILQNAGSPAVFVVTEALSDSVLPDTPVPSRGNESIEDFARHCAESRSEPGTATWRILPQLRRNELNLEEARRDLAEAASLEHTLAAAADWLLDNGYLIRTQIAEIRRHLPREHHKILPANASGDPYVYELARGLVAQTDLSVNEANIHASLCAYQQVAPLTIAELWAFPLLLRVALIDELTSLALHVTRKQQLREAAYFWANRLAAGSRRGTEAFEEILHRMESEPVALEPYFITCLAEQLQDEEDALAPVQHWIEDRLKTPLTELVRTEHTSEAAERISTTNAFGSLRALARIDFTEVFESASLMDGELRADPSGIYGRSDFNTRDRCRRAVERMSRHSGVGELDVARHAVALAKLGRNPQSQHVAYYLLDDGVRQLEAEIHARIPSGIRIIRGLRARATVVYLTGVIGLTLGFTALALALAWDAGVRQQVLLAVLGILGLFPLSELAIQTLNALVISLFAPESLPKLDFKEGIPPEHATLVVIPMMLASVEVVRRELEKLEVRFLANKETNLFFSLFPDFTDAATPTAAGDDELLQAAKEGIDHLNARYSGGRFLLFHRDRAWSESEQAWIGRERKRGKLEDLNAYLSGENPPDILRAGSLPLPIRYVMTLDADTQLPPEAARRMVATIAHPLNQAVVDADSKTRRRGFSIIQPRVSIALPGATATRFTRVFADTSGTDPYCQSVSDAQQDLFGEAIFHGKAIYDLNAFRGILADRFPLETLLSHDLIEGAHVGVGLASEIELFENLPLDYASYSQRQHRWIRGDWQIAAWMMGRVPAAGGGTVPNPLPVIGRWRIFDNLRRSLVPVASLLLLLFGWLISGAPGIWTLVIGLAVAIPALAPLLDRLARRLQGSVHGWQGATDELVRALVMLVFLPHQAWLAMDAIIRALYRRHVSHRKLLEWRTAEGAGGNAQRQLTLRQMWVICGCSLALLILLALKGAIAPAALFVALWAASPAVIRWLDRTVPVNDWRRPPREDAIFLRRLARYTWRFFDDLVAADTNWLPPDNTQLSLNIEVAQRTSPTNIGLWLTSALAAHDLAYLTADEVLRRASNTLETLGRLERYEGHLLNWYDTKSLEPLLPRYVSTVDSGNLTASLWVLEQGCQDILRSPLIGPSCLRGLADTLSILQDACGRDPSAKVPLRALRRLLRGSVRGQDLIGRLRLADPPMRQLQDIGRWSDDSSIDRSYWVEALARELKSWIAALDRYLPWMETLARPPDSYLQALGEDAVKLRSRALHSAPSLQSLANGGATALDGLLSLRGAPHIHEGAAAWLDQLAEEYRISKANAVETVQRFEALTNTGKQFAAAINMGFLYDKQRRLFGIGYQVGGPHEFTSHYDLLASECRLASMVAIAKGDVPIEHWFSLGRPHSSSANGLTLLSWSGTMFEYLMPLLFMRTFANSLLDRACHGAVQRQIEYGREKGVPWGVSESAYSALDANRIYQYRAFGVPALALNQGVTDDLVIAPYATALALAVDPTDATENLRRLQEFGLDGPMGLYESIDFSLPSRKDGDRGVVIYAYMAHHQGMTLLSLDNLLHRGVMQRRFHGDLRIRAFESLLFERVPVVRIPLEERHPSLPPIHPAPAEEPSERTWKDDTSRPRVHLQGNGHYSLMVTNNGGGYSRWNDFDVTRWRSDTTLDAWGSFLYIRDTRSKAAWTAAHQPVGGGQGAISAHFSADRAEFHRRVFGIETSLDITVGVEDDVELRRLTVANHSLRSRHLEFTSYVELTLAPHGADKAHPAFSKMFVETEFYDQGILIAHRRPRSPEEAPIWAAHILIGATSDVQFETDREIFLGRGNTPETPAGLRKDLTGSIGTVLDPIFSLRCRAAIEPRDRLELSFITVVAPSRDALLALITKYRRSEAVARAFEMAWTRAQLEFRYLGVGPAAAHRFQDLASHLLYPNPALRGPGERLVRNRLGQSALWGDGISGDLPILAVTITEPRGVPLVRELLLAQAYWRLRGFKADLVILDQEAPSYDRPLHQQLLRQIEAHAPADSVNKPGGIYLRDWHAMTEEHRNLLLAVSSVVLGGSRGPLQQQLATARETILTPPFVPTGGPEEPSPPLPFLELPYFNGMGGFTADGCEYAIYLGPGVQTPVPWSNVMANSGFGTLVTESGTGCTWCGNSQANRLTPWHNDPVSDAQSEAIYLRDDETGALWTPTALPIREDDAYRARHRQGSTVFEHNSHSIGQELTVFVPTSHDGSGDPVKVYRLRLRNHSSRRRRLTVTFYAEWVLGATHEDQQLHVTTSYDEESGALLASQPWIGSYANHLGFVTATPRPTFHSGDRTQFLGRNGSMAKPAALRRAHLDNRTGPGLDPAGALQLSVAIDPQGQSEIVFLLGQAENVESVRALVKRYRDGGNVEKALAETHRWWDSTLSALQVHTPVLSTDFLLNRWLLYQSMSCRFWGRTALYQSSGAFGFRDQLQDSMAFLTAAPELTRAHILASAARQFVDGDVQHWWHAETGAGVRTRCSDDLIWLPYAVAHYIEVTGDAAILDEEVSWLEGAPLAAGEQERLFAPVISTHREPLWEHCRRALEQGSRFGSHGLPLFGSGDWNDGMNRVGMEGRGESVWLGWFLSTVLEMFSRTMEKRSGGAELAAGWRARAAAVAKSLEESAWDGEWYLRGFFDDGTPLGSHANQEARIDSLPQSWAVISNSASAERAARAMASAQAELVDERYRLVKLFTPPFDHSSPNPGYIMGYPQGLRENGGQYTHGSLWMAMAHARMGNANAAVHLLKLMSPVELTRTPEDVARYRAEPYIVSADVSAAQGKNGRSGWTWYTGSAAWMYRIWTEEILGFQLRGDTLILKPAIPDDWPGFELRYRHRSSTYEIAVVKDSASERTTLEVDGQKTNDNVIRLADDGATHRVTLRMGVLKAMERPYAAGSNGVSPSSAGPRQVLRIPIGEKLKQVQGEVDL